jgi:hypothetical protein
MIGCCVNIMSNVPMSLPLIRKHVRDKDGRHGSPINELAKAVVVNCQCDDAEQEYPDHGSLLLNKRNIPNLLVIRNAGMKHVLGQRRADVAKSSRSAAHLLAIWSDHPLRRRNATSERAGNDERNNCFVHRKLHLVEAALGMRTLKRLLANVNRT